MKDEKTQMAFAKYLKIKRIMCDKTQKDVAAALGISQQGYALYERGKREVSLPTLFKLAGILNFPPGEFFDNYKEGENQ